MLFSENNCDANYSTKHNGDIMHPANIAAVAAEAAHAQSIVLGDEMKIESGRLERLRTMNPFVLDNSIRETTIGQPRGHTVEDKWKIFEQSKKCGFREMIVASFSKAPQVDDEFVRQLVEKEHDLSLYYTFSGVLAASGNEKDNPIGLEKAIYYGLHNVIFVVNLSGDDFSHTKLIELLIRRLRTASHKLHGGLSKCFINFCDFSTTMAKDPSRVFGVAAALAQMGDLRPRGIIFEEPTGIFSPNTVGIWTSQLRSLLKSVNWDHALMLVHVHEKWSMAQAVQLTALSMGADGIWAGVCNEGAGYGHAGSAVTLMNLVRLGNTKVQKKYKCKALRDAAAAVSLQVTRYPPYPTQPVYGARALDHVFDFGGIAGGTDDQLSFNLAEFFGVSAPERISTFSTPNMILKQLQNLFGESPSFTLEISAAMKQTIIDSLVANEKDEYMTPMGLAILFSQAGGELTEEMITIIEDYPLES